ncbi:hypothetical protein Mgra_00000705 [Meloidogyne graminicola]|uniref:Biogenesis of lysosome-related organelles complex 1 subunit 7 n=1 Tax=Meloidogyne graminicola TaxID=189291 RepID=A0A8T0A2Z0_9BILA|nr:hypothetical protein Mgra_00000705 [Meloidogyne graminicola]
MAASTSKLSSTCKIDENEEQKQQPSISSTNEDDEQQPPVIGGGTEMGEAIMEMIRPAVQRLDDQVKCTRKSQILLASHIDELSKKLKGIVDEQTLPYDLDIYVRKLEESRKRMFNVNQRLQSLHGRVSQLQRSAAREIQKQRQTTSTQQ